MLSIRREPNALPVSWDGSAHVSPLSFSPNKHYLTLHTHLLRWALIISGNPPHELGCCFPPFCLPLRPSSSYTQRIMSVVKPKVLTGWHSAPVLSVSLRAADHSFFKIEFGACLLGGCLEEVSEDELMLEIIPVVNFPKDKDYAGSSCAESHG